MSCYEWESGSVKLSCAEYRRFLKEFRGEWNKTLDAAHARAKKLHTDVLKTHKGKRGIDNWYQVVSSHVIDSQRYTYGMPITHTVWDFDHTDLIMQAFGYGSYGSENREKRPRNPQKKFFKHATSKVRRFDSHTGECSVSFDDKSRTVTWGVGENNHACERAHESSLGKIFFKLMGTVKWTRGTGGTIVGNDEYNRDNDGVGGGGNLIKEAYGPLGKQDAERNARFAMCY
jgi:hypothetical protein